MIVVPPCRGEFGLKIRYHVPQVHALVRKGGEVVVFHEEGEEALYPGVARRIVVAGIPDDNRRGMWPKTDRDEARRLALSVFPGARLFWSEAKAGREEARFLPDPSRPPSFPTAPVVICPRFRRYGSAKNWDGWAYLARALGPIAVAAGNAEASYTGVDELVSYSTWRSARPLDATIRALRRADCVIATDAGLAHLAVLCGVPELLLVTYRGRVAPGPVMNAAGLVLEEKYWPVRLEEYYEKANHAGTRIRLVDGWEDPRKVLDLVRVGGVV